MQRTPRQGLPPLVFLTLLVALTGAATLLAESRWRGPAGGFLPFETDAEVLEFLSEAEVVKKKDIPQGINKPLKVRLELDGVVANAIFRTVNVKKARHQSGSEVYVNFHDSYLFECAAYEVSRLLGLDHVPPCVVRQLGRRHGTMQLWVEEAMTEVERRKRNQRAPLIIDWKRQQQVMYLFDALIYNFDRNQGNMLIDPDWKLWFIDHTRSFHVSEKLVKAEKIIWVERGLWSKFQALDRETLTERLAGLVSEERIDYLLQRHRLLVELVGERIARSGEDAVLYDASLPAPSGAI